MKKRTILLLVVVAAVGGGITWQALKPPEPTKVLTAKVEVVESLKSIVSATGEIQAKEFVDIQAEVTGIIVEVLVEEGQHVEKGQVLLRLEDLPFRADEDAARAQVKAAEADAKNAEVGVATAKANLAAEKTVLASMKLELEQAKTTRDRSRASLNRKKELFQQQLIGSEEFEVAAADARLAEQRLEWNEARLAQGDANIHAADTRVDAAEAVRDGQLERVEAAKAALKRSSDVLQKTVLRAPISGLITKLNVEKGERAVPGIQSNPVATLMTIADMSVIEAEISVAEADIVMVEIGALAVIEVDAMRDVEIRGQVTEVGQSPIQESTGGAANQEGKDFKVVIRLDEPLAALRPGFTATADITTATRESVLVIPLQAQTAREVELDAEQRYVRPPEPIDDSLATPVSASQRRNLDEVEGVFVMENGRAHFRPVKLGIIGDMDVEVLDGLQADETVVIGPIKALRTLEEWDHIAVDEKRQRENVVRLRKKR
ncbi:MAG: efflux RND transporter periplasmic adaptor subunit [bacterium]|nr:efflux RND transporter periplasmic adaptor subunit [bacterium]